jgi:hypothetical protein
VWVASDELPSFVAWLGQRLRLGVSAIADNAVMIQYLLDDRLGTTFRVWHPRLRLLPAPLELPAV